MRIILGLLIAFTSLTSFGQNQAYESGELIIQFNSNTDPIAFVRKFEAEQKIGVLEINELSDIVNIYHLKLTDLTINLDRTARILYSYPEVKIVQKNHFVSSRETIPTDVMFGEQWHLLNTGVDGGVADADIDATDAWDITTGGVTTHNDTVVVCVIEGSGVDISHVDLQGNLWKNYAEIPDDGIDNDGNGYIDDYDGWNVLTEDDQVGSGSHGTRVCGMIGAKGNNGIGVSGVNWDVKMMVIKGQQASNEASVIAAYAYPLKMRKKYNESFGAEGAFVVATNASWGIDGGDPADSPLWCAMYDSLGAYGIISVGATTNDDANVDVIGDLPTTCTSEYFIGVTMTNKSDIRAGSGYGATSVDLAAPGSQVRLTTPGDSYSTTSGTSFAAPCVTGAIALAYSAPCPSYINFVKFDPAAAALQMRDYIFNGVDELDALSSDVATGGRLNVKNSIDLLMADCDSDVCIAPYNIRSSTITDTSATFSWDGFTANYKLTIQAADGATTVVDVTDTSTVNFDTLTPCTIYTITIQADCDGDGFSDPSFPFVFTTDGCCTNPALTNPLKTEDALTIEWPSILYATTYNFRYSKLDEDDWTELTDVSAPLVIDELDQCSEYEFQINTICTDSTRGFSESFVFRTLGCGVCTELEYCPVVGGSSNLEWIDSIAINGYSNGTGPNAGWLQSEQIITALTPGESYSIRIRPTFAGATFTERYSIFIDFNQNGVFDIATERVLYNYSTTGAAVQTIDIPASALVGVTRIRIGMSALSPPNECPTDNFFGEYEDYCVYIGPQLSIPENELVLRIYPNPANALLYVEASEKIEQIKVFSNDGKQVLQFSSLEQNALNISHLSSGIYIIRVETVNGIVTQKFVKQ